MPLLVHSCTSLRTEVATGKKFAKSKYPFFFCAHPSAVNLSVVFCFVLGGGVGVSCLLTCRLVSVEASTAHSHISLHSPPQTSRIEGRTEPGTESFCAPLTINRAHGGGRKNVEEQREASLPWQRRQRQRNSCSNSREDPRKGPGM